MAPFLQPTDDNKSGLFQCETCDDYETKRRWHCGYIDKSEWYAPDTPPASHKEPLLPPQIGPVDLREINICPGWLTRTPGVLTAYKAAHAYKHGALPVYFPKACYALTEVAQTAVVAQSECEAYRLKKQ